MSEDRQISFIWSVAIWGAFVILVNANATTTQKTLTVPGMNGTSGSTRGPSVFGGGGVATWEITDFPKCKICVLGNKPSVDICTNLMRSFIEDMRFHESQNLTELSDGKCVYISSIGPPNNSENGTICCMVTGKYSPDNDSKTDVVRLHFYNDNLSDVINVVGYWGARNQPFNCVDTAFPY